jgi:hypothetical protein
MADVRLDEFRGETIVVHFGGEPSSINVYTLTRSLADFPRFTHDLVLPDVTPTQRTNSATARLIILKAWLNQAKRKWSFEWNGVPVSAPIKDPDFLDDIARRKYLIGAGDALDVEISSKQTFDEQLKVFVTDPNSYVVTKVLAHVPKETPSL